MRKMIIMVLCLFMMIGVVSCSENYIYGASMEKSVNKFNQNGDRIWKVSTDVAVDDLYVDDNGNVIWCGKDKVGKINSKGDKIWNYVTISETVKDVESYHGDVYFGEGDSPYVLYKLDDNGDEKWSYDNFSVEIYSLEYSSGDIYVMTKNATLKRISIDGENEDYLTSFDNNEYKPELEIEGNSIYAGFDSSLLGDSLVKMDLDGNQLWRVNTTGVGGISDVGASNLGVFVGGSGDNEVKRYTSDGGQDWNISFDSSVKSIYAGDEYIFVGTGSVENGNRLHKLDEDGNIIWSKNDFDWAVNDIFAGGESPQKPEFQYLNDKKIIAGDEVEFNFTATDVNGDNLNYEITNNEQLFNDVDYTNQEAVWDTTEYDFDSYEIEFKVSDDKHEVMQEVQLDVYPPESIQEQNEQDKTQNDDENVKDSQPSNAGLFDNVMNDMGDNAIYFSIVIIALFIGVYYYNNKK